MAAGGKQRLHILEAAEKLRKREVSPVELTRECLARIEQRNAMNAYITITADLALQQAQQAEAEIQRGDWRGPLHGIPIGLKDLIDTAGIKTTAASALFKDRIPGRDAEVLRRLKAAGAVLLGKHNLHEFAYGGSSMISYYGEVRNPWSPGHIAGGSSGGSAAAVAAGLCYAAIGTDTAGSVREPASLCGVVGFKPTYGRISSRGVIPLSRSLDHAGPITATVADAAILLQALAGHDPQDPTSGEAPVPDYLALMCQTTHSMRVGVPRQFFYDNLDPRVDAAMRQAFDVLRRMTASIHEIEIPVSTDRTLQAAESYAYHAENVRKTPELYHPETLRRILTGANISESDYQRCRQELEETRRNIGEIFRDLDVLITPAVPVPAPSIRELKENPEALRPREILLLRNTRPVNVWGLPAISVPCGFTEDSLPIGLQIIGAPWGEGAVLRLAHAYEQATAWHKRTPKQP